MSSRLSETIQAEILLKVLAYNLMRLETAAAAVPICVSLVATPTRIRILAARVPLPPVEPPSGPVNAVLLLYPV